MAIADFALGGYRFIPGVFQYSGGVVALPGYEIQRVRFRQPVPLALGFERIGHWLHGAGRPLTAFCACELRSPAPFTEDGFRAFNKVYVVTLGEWGLFDGTVNPVARSNVCPEIDPPAEPCFHAFSYTVDVPDAPPSFVISGSGEAREGGATYIERIIRRGETNEAAMREKAQFVLDVMGQRLAQFGLGWADTTASQVYTVRDLYPFLADEIVRRGAAHAGLTWHFARPPVRELEFEMDCRGIAVERAV
jgi:hypothetical protein